MKNPTIGKLLMTESRRLGIVKEIIKTNTFTFYKVEYLSEHLNPVLNLDKEVMIDYATLQFWLDNYVKYRKANNI